MCVCVKEDEVCVKKYWSGRMKENEERERIRKHKGKLLSVRRVRKGDAGPRLYDH